MAKKLTKKTNEKDGSLQTADGSREESAKESTVPAIPVKTGVESENAENSPVEAVESESTKVSTDPANAPQAQSCAVEFPAADKKDSSREEVAEESAAVSTPAPNQCPRCKHVSSDRAVKLGPPNRSRCSIKIDGVQYHTVEAQRILCEKCKQLHFVKKYK